MVAKHRAQAPLPDLEAKIADFERRFSKRGIGAFPDFNSAYAWHDLFGQRLPEPPPSGGGNGAPEPQPDDDGEGDGGNDSQEPSAGNQDQDSAPEDPPGSESNPIEGDQEPDDDGGDSPQEPQGDPLSELPGTDDPTVGDDGDDDEESTDDAELSADPNDFTEGEPEGESESPTGGESPDGPTLDEILESLRAPRTDRPPERERPEPEGWDKWGYSVAHKSEDRIHREFESWISFVRCCDDDSLLGWKTRRHSHYTPDHPDWAGLGRSEQEQERRLKLKTHDWAGTWDWETCIDMATRTGWPEGRKLMHESLIAVQSAPAVFESIAFDIVGAFPVIPLYCAQDPSCMMDFTRQTSMPDPLVRIDIRVGAAVTVSGESLMLRGAAALSLADKLESMGRSTEIRLTILIRAHTSLPGLRNDSKKDFSYAVVFKKAGQPWDLDRAAFALAHPSVPRRLGFALLEQHAELEPAFKNGYGHPIQDEPLPDTHPSTIFIPGVRSSDIETPESARAVVEAAAQKFLEENGL